MECPTFKGEWPAKEAWIFMQGGFSGYRPPSNSGGVSGLSYGYNGYGLGSADQWTWGSAPKLGLGEIHLLGPAPRTVKTYDVINPSDMVAIADSMPQVKYPDFYAHLLSINTRDMPDKDRHGGRDNIAYVDGHVSDLRHRDFIDNTPENRRRWNIDNQTHDEIPLNSPP